MLRFPRRAALPAALALLVLPETMHAQIPDEFTNLKIFPEDISKDELVENMRQFCFALGVRCTYCHVEKQDNPSRVDDYSLDDKAEKRKARVMLEMVKAINESHLPKLPERGDVPVEVSCATCHGGIRTPMQLEDHLDLVRESDGMDAALARYRALREKYYGTTAYNFGPRSLMNLGERRLDAGAPEEAVAAFELNREFHPESVEVIFNLAKAYRAAERDDDAIAAYRKVLELSPEGGWARSAQEAIAEISGG